MGNIRVLSEVLRNQIAAGEVVERPANIVKELVENSIDAGARHIDIEVEDGGLEWIVVRDDGNGMDAEDARLALKRHATSKISTSDDLFSLDSFGFRGEALAAISAVSDLTLTTRQETALSGIRLRAESEDLEPVAAPVGTEIRVENLFHTVPARLKFLKSMATESARIVEIVEHMALAAPETAFRLTINGRRSIDVSGQSGANNSKNRLIALYGKELGENLFPIHYLGTDLAVSGFTSHPHLHRRTRKNQRIFVNDRPISDRLVFAALAEAYESLIPRGFYPESVIFLRIAPDLVDVNVHPRKSEVKFLREREVFLAVRGAVKSALEKAEAEEKIHVPAARSWTLHSSPTSDMNRNTGPGVFSGAARKDFFSDAPSFRKEALAPNFRNEVSETASDSSWERESKERGEAIPQQWKIIGQIRKSFILVEAAEGLLIFDQHAAHERVRYEKLMRELRERKRESQKLLLPQIFVVSPSERATLSAHQEIFEQFGFEIREFSETEIAVFAVPAGLEHSDLRTELRNLLAELEGTVPEEGRIVSKAAERIATFAACRGAIKFGDPITLSEMERLLEDLAACDGFTSCAHGRPVAMRISYDEMEGTMGR